MQGARAPNLQSLASSKVAITPLRTYCMRVRCRKATTDLEQIRKPCYKADLQRAGAISRRVAFWLRSRAAPISLPLRVKCRLIRWLLVCFLAAICLPARGQTSGQTTWRDPPLGTDLAWHPARADLPFVVDVQRRVPGAGHVGQTAEEIRLSGTGGSYIDFSHAVPTARISSELAATVWIKADHPGLQIFGHAVLPHTIDPKTGQPATVLLPGVAYSQAGVWQEIRLDNTPLWLERQARVLRLQLGPGVDTRDAYLDQVWLNLYGGPGATDALVDDLELSGLEPISPMVIQQAAAQNAAAGGAAGFGIRPMRQVRLDGSVLTIDGHPFFPRIFPFRGEPLVNLSRAGFNAVRFNTPPTFAQLAEAEQAGLWVIAPPPRQNLNSVTPIGPEFDSVLAWHLGDNLTGEQLDSTLAEIRQLREADIRGHRPIVCGPDAELRPYSRQADLLELSRLPLGTSLELNDYCQWMQSRDGLARPGTPFWTRVQTQIWPATRQQQTLVTRENIIPEVDCESMRLLTYLALTSGARGIEFQSDRPLMATPVDMQLSLALLNMELELLEPWTTVGGNISLASSNDPQVTGFVIQTDRARLLLMMRLAAGSQHVPKPKATAPATIVVPGVPESHAVYELTPVGLRPINHERVTGGTQITIDEFQLSALVLLTPDPVVIDTLQRRLAAMSMRAAELQRDLAVQTMARLDVIDRQLPPRPGQAPQAVEWLTKARTEMADADKALTAGDRASAYAAARRAIGPMEQYKRLRWEQAATTQNSPVVSPLVAAFDTLPAHWQLVDQLRLGQPSLNLLPGGECENLDAMRQAGWQTFAHPQPSVVGRVELSPVVSHSGHSSLHMQVVPAIPQEPPTQVETPPIWITSAPVIARRGDIVEFRGWVRVPVAITGSVDGLMILDSIAGEALAERALKTPGWREFVLYRVAPRDGPVWITFALTGLGNVWIDDVTIQTISPRGTGPTQMPLAIQPTAQR